MCLSGENVLNDKSKKKKKMFLLIYIKETPENINKQIWSMW